MVQRYPIHSWNGVHLSHSAPQPGLLIRPDESLISYSKPLQVKITGTDSGYENTLCYAQLQPSEITRGFRPNFQEQTGYWVLLLSIPWEGYPLQNGTVEILNEDIEPKEQEPIDSLQDIRAPHMTAPSLEWIPYLFVLILLILRFFNRI